METLKSPSEEDIFISTVLFETIMTIWSGCENSLAWYATDHERCMVLKKIISSMNIQDVETCVKYGTQEHKSESLRVFQVSVNLAKILSYEEVEEFLKTSKMEEFDIIQHILSPYQCQNSKDKQEIFKNSTRAIFIDYLNDKQELINSHLEFFTNFDDQDLLQFVVEKVSSDVLQELGAKADGALVLVRHGVAAWSTHDAAPLGQGGHLLLASRASIRRRQLLPRPVARSC